MIDCQLCLALREEKDLIIKENEHSFWILNIAPLIQGHSMVVSKRHVKEIDELSNKEASSFLQMIGYAVRILQKAYNQTAATTMMKHGAFKSEEHLHAQILPKGVPIRTLTAEYFKSPIRERKTIQELKPVADMLRKNLVT